MKVIALASVPKRKPTAYFCLKIGLREWGTVTYLSKEALTMGLEDLLKAGWAAFNNSIGMARQKNSIRSAAKCGDSPTPVKQLFRPRSLLGVVLFFDDHESDLAHLAR